jgi:hypothetical protein
MTSAIEADHFLNCNVGRRRIATLRGTVGSIIVLSPGEPVSLGRESVKWCLITSPNGGHEGKVCISTSP